MEGRSESGIVFLDTHIVVWLYASDSSRLSSRALDLIEENDLFVSPMVELELQYLYEIGRIIKTPEEVLQELSYSIGLQVADSSLKKLIKTAKTLTWTRDPFDKMITAEAMLSDSYLISVDNKIRENYEKCIS
ncbi:PIN domain-containing protein [Candidatus Dojkabacteria bacterium]|uniref:PIN domain-containing protein n=1 Tax=Candidatus Dojkabacteria bacterium TaxID=2099670 RepID=A0A955RLY0_9BACT|nr:PIN domain-containing protein [Candidatus Dojkabacteria bacterium]